MTDAAVDAFVASISTSIRRSLYQRLKGLNLSQTELTALLATATRTAVERTYVAELAAVATAGAAGAEAYAAAMEEGDPLDPAVIAWRERRDSAPLLVRELFL